ncbi:MAG: hypothetical protein RR840_03415 [Clostridium sp.]
MSINNISNDYRVNSYTQAYKNINVRETNQSKVNSGNIKDVIDIQSTKGIETTSSVSGFIMDKGTAAHTTLYVDRSSFDQIMNFTTNNPDCQWEELGMDEEKRWIVVNGQRFECPLTNEEKEMIKRAKKGFLDILGEAKEDKKDKPNDKSHLKISIDENNKLRLDGNNNALGNDKITNLMKNDKVVNMLTSIMKANGGSLNISL